MSFELFGLFNAQWFPSFRQIALMMVVTVYKAKIELQWNGNEKQTLQIESHFFLVTKQISLRPSAACLASVWKLFLVLYIVDSSLVYPIEFSKKAKFTHKR